MKSVLLAAALFMAPLLLLSQPGGHLSSKEYKADFEFFWKSIDEEYCYFNKKHTDWQRIREIYLPMIDTVQSRESFVTILEKTLSAIYDHHAGLNTNTPTSFRLVPTGTDIWAEYSGDKAMITEIRKGSGAESCGLIAGMEVIAINDEPVKSAIERSLPPTLKDADPEAWSYTLRTLLAGNHVQPRRITARNHDKQQDYYPDQAGMLLDHLDYPSLIESKLIGAIGYIRINNCLYDNNLVPAFDSVMQLMKNTTGLVLDLRETPSGGNTSVARAILGWFTSRDKFYQKHEYYYEEKSTGIKRSWEEIVSPRQGKRYTKPLVILCDHWTGSIAEGICIGFDALERPHTLVIGTQMARLNGAVYSYQLPNSGIHFSFPAERLYHVNGLPREQFVPTILIKPKDLVPHTDPFMDKALQYLKQWAK
jgi:carboxyl-terminal processing protease